MLSSGNGLGVYSGSLFTSAVAMETRRKVNPEPFRFERLHCQYLNFSKLYELSTKIYCLLSRLQLLDYIDILSSMCHILSKPLSVVISGSASAEQIVHFTARGNSNQSLELFNHFIFHTLKNSTIQSPENAQPTPDY